MRDAVLFAMHTAPVIVSKVHMEYLPKLSESPGVLFQNRTPHYYSICFLHCRTGVYIKYGLLRMVQVSVSLLIMLLIMSMNGWLLLLVLTSSTLGYFISAWLAIPRRLPTRTAALITRYVQVRTLAHSRLPPAKRIIVFGCELMVFQCTSTLGEGCRGGWEIPASSARDSRGVGEWRTCCQR